MPGLRRRPHWIASTIDCFRRDGALRPGRLLLQDLRTYVSRWPTDWKPFNRLIFASAVYVFFTNLLPGITFAADLFNLTGQNWGAIEIVFATGLCGIIFSLFSVQPLVILGITGPFSVLAETIYELCEKSFNIEFLPFMAWCLIHSGWMHILLAVFNAHDWTMMYVTEMSCEVFSLLNSIIYFHKAIQELERAHQNLSLAGFLYSIIGAVGTFLLALCLSTAEKWPPLFHRYIRMSLREYAAAIAIILFIGIPYMGELKDLDKTTLYTSSSGFRPTSPARTHFFVRFWEMPVAWIFAAIIPGFIITVLFYFDHEISSIICTIKRYGIKKPTGYAQDIFLLGVTTAICGILGLPPANGLLPQAPLHSESLLHAVNDEHIESITVDEYGIEHTIQTPVQRVYEQRYSHLLHASAILVFISPPFQHVLGLTPTSVLAGLFIFMGQQSLSVNPILRRFFYLLTPASELPPLPPGVKSWWPVHGYTVFQVVMTVVVFIVTLTVASPAFPLIIVALVPFRLLVMNRMWDREVLRFVDQWACREGKPEDEGSEDQVVEIRNVRLSSSNAVEDVEKGAIGASAGSTGASSGVDVDEGGNSLKR